MRCLAITLCLISSACFGQDNPFLAIGPNSDLFMGASNDTQFVSTDVEAFEGVSPAQVPLQDHATPVKPVPMPLQAPTQAPKQYMNVRYREPVLRRGWFRGRIFSGERSRFLGLRLLGGC